MDNVANVMLESIRLPIKDAKANRVFDTIGDVANAVENGEMRVGNYVRTLGFYSKGDGGGGHYTLVADGGDVAVGSIMATVTESGCANVKMYGAKGDGVADDTAVIQKLLNAGSGITEIYFPKGKYLVTSPITISKAVHIYGDGFGQTGENTNGSGDGLSTIIANTNGAGFLINALKYIFNVIIENLEIDGYNKCTNGIALYSGVMCSFLNLHIRNCQNTGILISNNLGYLCQFNRVCNYDYVYGVSAVTENSAALKISGNTDDLTSQNYIENIRSLCKNNAIVLAHTDNNVFTKCFGYSVNSKMLLLTDGANNNYFDYITGQVEQKNSFGNVLNHWTSEGAVMKMDGTNPIAYNLVDYVTGESFKTDFYWMSKTLNFGAGDITLGSNTGLVYTTKGIPYAKFAGAGSIGVSRKVHNFNNGTITTASIYYFSTIATSLTVTYNYSHLADLHSIDENNVTGTINLVTSVPNAIYRAIVPLGQIIEKNDLLSFSLTSDKVSSIGIFAIDIDYVSAGPHSAGSGPFDVPRLENIHS